MELCGTKKGISWFFQIVASAILAQTLFFKFTGSAESKFIFQTLGLEPVGRIGVGVAELIAVVLLLTPRTVTWGALLGVGLMTGAIFGHLTKLGIEVQNDGGLLFALAFMVLASSIIILFVRRSQIPFLGRYFPTGCSIQHHKSGASAHSVPSL